MQKTWETTQKLKVESPMGVVANMLDSDIIVSEFKLQSCYYVHFQINTVGKGVNPLIPPAMS